jgi:hypothetical protein
MWCKDEEEDAMQRPGNEKRQMQDAWWEEHRTKNA